MQGMQWQRQQHRNRRLEASPRLLLCPLSSAFSLLPSPRLSFSLITSPWQWAWQLSLQSLPARECIPEQEGLQEQERLQAAVPQQWRRRLRQKGLGEHPSVHPD